MLDLTGTIKGFSSKIKDCSSKIKDLGRKIVDFSSKISGMLVTHNRISRRLVQVRLADAGCWERRALTWEEPQGSPGKRRWLGDAVKVHHQNRMSQWVLPGDVHHKVHGILTRDDLKCNANIDAFVLGPHLGSGKVFKLLLVWVTINTNEDQRTNIETPVAPKRGKQ